MRDQTINPIVVPAAVVAADTAVVVADTAAVISAAWESSGDKSVTASLAILDIADN